MNIFFSQILEIEDDSYYRKYLLSFDYRLTRDNFLKNAKVKQGSFAEEIALKLYKSTVENSLNLNYDYAKFYRDEFDSFEIYLGRKLLFDDDIIEKIICLDSNYITHYIDSEVLPNSSLVNAFFDSEIIQDPGAIYNYEN